VAPPLAEIRRHAATEGFRPGLRYTGQDTATLIGLALAGHGLTLLPETAVRLAGVTAVPVRTPRLRHRTELLHTALPDGSPAVWLAAALAGNQD
jgi:DNA-binding transcriptional LysR family regulator